MSIINEALKKVGEEKKITEAASRSRVKHQIETDNYPVISSKRPREHGRLVFLSILLFFISIALFLNTFFPEFFKVKQQILNIVRSQKEKILVGMLNAPRQDGGGPVIAQERVQDEKRVPEAQGQTKELTQDAQGQEIASTPEEIPPAPISPPSLVLNGIFYDSEKPYAIVNDKVLVKGDVIEGATLMRIGRNTVQFTFGEEQFEIKPER